MITSRSRAASSVRRLLAGGGLLLALGSPGLMRAAAPLIQYNFNEGTGTTVANSGSLGSGANLTLDNIAGTLTHDSWVSAGNTLTGTGSALTLDGASKNQSTAAYVTGDGTSLNTGLASFTITAWVNLSPLNSVTDAGARLVAFADGSNGFDLRLNTISGELASLSLFVDGTAVTSSSGTTTVDVVGQWTFLAVTYDGNATTSNVSFYNGGSSVGATALGTAVTLNKGAVNTVVSGVTTALRIGSSGSTNTDRTPAGSFDDVRIYGSVLDASAIEAIRASDVSPIPEPSSVALIFAGVSLVAAGVLRRRRR